MTYTATVSNIGPSSASNVSLSSSLGAGATLVSATPSQGVCAGTAPITCNLGSLATATQATVTLVAKATTTGSVNTNALAVAAEYDPNSANNTATTTTQVTAVDLVPTALSASKANSKITIGDTVVNQGVSNAGAFVVAYYLSTDTVFGPDDLPLVTTPDGNVPCIRTATGLGAGVNSTVKGTICYKPGNTISKQQYYVLVVADSNGQIAETNETNNVLATSGTMKW